MECRVIKYPSHLIFCTLPVKWESFQEVFLALKKSWDSKCLSHMLCIALKLLTCSRLLKLLRFHYLSKVQTLVWNLLLSASTWVLWGRNKTHARLAHSLSRSLHFQKCIINWTMQPLCANSKTQEAKRWILLHLSCSCRFNTNFMHFQV